VGVTIDSHWNLLSAFTVNTSASMGCVGLVSFAFLGEAMILFKVPGSKFKVWSGDVEH
jgi:hypothetical protein